MSARDQQESQPQPGGVRGQEAGHIEVSQALPVQFVAQHPALLQSMRSHDSLPVHVRSQVSPVSSPPHTIESQVWLLLHSIVHAPAHWIAVPLPV